jgi:hypothetical protein
VEARRLELLRADAWEERARVALDLGDPEDAVRRLEGLLAGHPFREHAVGLLMTALCQAGRTGDALARYRDHHRRMADELGLDPSPALPELQACILGQGRPRRAASDPVGGPAWLDTNNDLTLVLAAWPQAEVAQVKRDLQGNYLREVTAALGDRLDGGRQETRVVGEGVPNRFRTPYGPGWALVGDAGYAKDPVTAQGITDAFRDAELCAGALDAAWRGSRGYDEALGEYQQHRDERVLPMYEFASMWAGALPAPEFLNPAHIASLTGADAQVPG